MDRAYGTLSQDFIPVPVFHTHSLVEAAHFVATDFNPLYELQRCN